MPWTNRYRSAWYGGNKIPDGYLDAFNKRTEEWLNRVTNRKPLEAYNVPSDVQRFLEDLG